MVEDITFMAFQSITFGMEPSAIKLRIIDTFNYILEIYIDDAPFAYIFFSKEMYTRMDNSYFQTLLFDPWLHVFQSLAMYV